MSIATEVTYVDGVTAVSAAWLNLIQEHLAGWVNVQVSAAGQVVTIGATADDGAASCYINGEQRWNEGDITFTFTGSEATNTYDVYIVGDGAGPGFTMEVVSGPPVGTNTRKIAEVDYDTTLDTITDMRVERGRFEEHDHSLLSGTGQPAHADLAGLTTGDPHTQYMLPDGSRPFTGVQVGVDPVAGSDLATKGYSDGLSASGVPVGTVLPYGAAVAPSGWLLCDGASFLNATYPILAALLNDVYGGDGGTNTNVPDLKGVFPMGVAVSGTGSSLGDSGGTLDHTHTQPTHVHAEAAHTHAMTAHTHSSASTALGGAHTHTQPSTGASSTHTHTGPAHTHGDGSLVVANTSTATVGSREASSATAGLFAENDLDTSSDNSSHLHGFGSYTCPACGTTSGSTASSTFSHSHFPTSNAGQHTHASGAVSGSTASAGTGVTGSGGAHSHTNASTGTSVEHTHTVGVTVSALTVTDANASPPNTGAGGGDVTGLENAPFQAVTYIIKRD